MEIKKIVIRYIVLAWFLLIFIVYSVNFLSKFAFIFPEQAGSVNSLVNFTKGLIERIL